VAVFCATIGGEAIPVLLASFPMVDPIISAVATRKLDDLPRF
jgi:hypothetical protein